MLFRRHQLLSDFQINTWHCINSNLPMMMRIVLRKTDFKIFLDKKKKRIHCSTLLSHLLMTSRFHTLLEYFALNANTMCITCDFTLVLSIQRNTDVAQER